MPPSPTPAQAGSRFVTPVVLVLCAGHRRPLIADLYKAEFTIPLAFDMAARGLTRERDARLSFRDRVADGNLMATVVRDIKTLLLEEDIDPSEADVNELWDETAGSVPGGISWATAYADSISADSILGVTGPEIDEHKAAW